VEIINDPTPSKNVLDALLNLAQALPVKRPDIISTSIEKVLYDISNNPKFTSSKEKAEKVIEVFDRATDLESGNAIHEQFSRKRKLEGGVRWLPDSQLVIENDALDEDYGGPEESAIVGDTQKRKSKCGTTILWRNPPKMESKYEKPKEKFQSAIKEDERIKDIPEANYYHPSLIPPNPLGPPVYNIINNPPPVVIEFGPVDIPPNTAEPKPATKTTKAATPKISEPVPVAEVHKEAAPITDLFRNPDLLKALSSAVPPTSSYPQMPPSGYPAAPPMATPDMYHATQVREEKSYYGYPEQMGVQMYPQQHLPVRFIF
jgi:hypothetical protein